MNISIFEKRKLGYNYILIIIFLLVAILQLISVNILNIYYNLTAVLLYLIFGIVLFKGNPLLFSLLFLFYFGQGWAIFANVFLERGFFIIEQNQWSYATGSTIRLVMYSMFFLICCSLLFKFIIRGKELINIKRSLMWEKTVFYFCLIVILTIVSISVFKFNAPILLNVDRFSYWLGHPFLLLKTLIGQFTALSFLLGILYIQSSNRITKNIAVLFFMLIMLLFIFFGEKFTGLFHSIYFFTLPFFINRFADKKTKPSVCKMIGFFMIIFLLFSPIIGYHYMNIHTGESIPKKIIERVVLQGHVWWGTDKLVLGGNFSSSEQFIKEIGNLYMIDPDRNNLGMRFLMKTIAPSRIAEAYIERGINFTMGYPAIALYLFGYYGLFVAQLLAGILTVISLKYLYNKVLKKQIILGLLAVKIFIVIYGSFTMGNYFEIFSIKVLFYVFVSVYLELIFAFKRCKKIKREI